MGHLLDVLARAVADALVIEGHSLVGMKRHQCRRSRPVPHVRRQSPEASSRRFHLPPRLALRSWPGLWHQCTTDLPTPPRPRHCFLSACLLPSRPPKYVSSTCDWLKTARRPQTPMLPAAGAAWNMLSSASPSDRGAASSTTAPLVVSDRWRRPTSEWNAGRTPGSWCRSWR